MPDPVKTSEPIPIPPVTVTVIGETTRTGVPIPSGTVFVTPDHQPNVIYQVITPIAAILVRFANAYLTMLVGLIGVGMTSNAIPAPDFLHLVLKCAGLSVAGAAFGAIKDCLTIFGKLEGKFPLATGSI